MSQARCPMELLRLRLRFEEGFSQRVIARALGVVHSTVERVLQRFAASGCSPISSHTGCVWSRGCVCGEDLNRNG